MALSAVLGIVSGAFAETPQPAQKKKVISTAKAKKPVAKSNSASKTATSKTSVAKSTVKSNTKSAKNATPTYRRSGQITPTLERYQEIQQALSDRGYFEGPADGKWGVSSTEALKRFQREQSLVEDGKIGSLSLIALGLGPKRGATTESAIRSAQQQPPPQQ